MFNFNFLHFNAFNLILYDILQYYFIKFIILLFYFHNKHYFSLEPLNCSFKNALSFIWKVVVYKCFFSVCFFVIFYLNYKNKISLRQRLIN